MTSDVIVFLVSLLKANIKDMELFKQTRIIIHVMAFSLVFVFCFLPKMLSHAERQKSKTKQTDKPVITQLLTNR